MGDIAIRAENLSKSYQIGVGQESYRNFRDAIVDAVQGPFKRVGRLLRGDSYGAAEAHKEFWALRDISFEIKHGEVVGIIGRNGAGKSTLLKILSRITEPTGGYADIYGRVGALLEVGTGFHPELTGRENILLNGTILGMKRQEIARKLDEIVAFAEVEQFIDTPVKHYSSGMGLRLGFAVAAHLEPEILIVDEVLAVGDLQFQRKCMGKMSEVSKEGRTILFVSHNMASIQQLCNRGILLENGHVKEQGNIDDIINTYLNSVRYESTTKLVDRVDRQGGKNFRFTDCVLLNKDQRPVELLSAGEEATFVISYENLTNSALDDVDVSIRIDDMMGQRLFTVSNRFTGERFDPLQKSGQLVCHIPSLPLVADNYKVFLWSGAKRQVLDAVEDAFRFSVVDADFYNTGKFPQKQTHGVMFLPHSWMEKHEQLVSI